MTPEQVAEMKTGHGSWTTVIGFLGFSHSFYRSIPHQNGNFIVFGAAF